MNDSQWTLLENFSSEAEARVVESRLKAEGLTVELLGVQSRAAGYMPGGLRLMVLTQDLESAKIILKNHR